MTKVFWRGAVIGSLAAIGAVADEPASPFPGGPGTNAGSALVVVITNGASPWPTALSDSPSNATQADAMSGPAGDPVMNRFDRWHERTSSNLMASVDRLDRFFGNDEAFEENRGTRVRVGLRLISSENDGTEIKSRTRVRLALPYMERRFHVLFESDGDTDDTESLAAVADALADRERFAGLRQVLKQTDTFSIQTDVGVRLGSHNPLFAKVRGRVTIPMGAWELRFGEQGRWYSKDGFSGVSEIRLSRPLGEGWIFQAVSSGTWEELLNGVALGQYLSFIREPVRRNAYRLDLYGTWPEVPYVKEEEYGATVTWRRMIHRDWIFLQVTPGVSFPEVYEYQANPMVTALVEIVFGESL